MSEKPKPLSLESAGLKARVLSAAGRLLDAQPADDLSLRAIADSAGVGLASMYHYFENKDQLLLSLAIEGLEDLRRDILQMQADPAIGSPMRGGHRAFFTFAAARPALFSLMFNERLMARHPTMREAEDRTFRAYLAAVEADGRIPSSQHENAARAIWALGRGIAAMMSSQPDGKLPPETAEKLFAGASYLINHRATD